MKALAARALLALGLLLPPEATPALAAEAPPPAARPAPREPRLPPRPDWLIRPPGPARQIGPSLWRPPPPPRVSPSALAAARSHLCPHGGTPLPGGRCRPGRGLAAAGAPGAEAADPAIAGWHRDLPPPTRAQHPCPPGTRPLPARDQPGVTRCLPE